MRAVIQRVRRASVTVDGECLSAIEQGLLVLLGVEQEDNERDARYLADKTIGLRIFEDEQGLMNRSLVDCGGAVLVVSQFTLLGDVRRGRRPSFVSAAAPEVARHWYEYYCQVLAAAGLAVGQGRFQADMQVALVNDGPVTILVDSRKQF
ncbi:MAG: D-tyrosyl-tRNA(Tyr) deacylase [Planctomycetales bacterium]|nr:D-tyrosyl-tRNA(Tyr) deacylase [Planctomycetales bacterium]